MPILFLKNNPGQFIWQSNRDGWNQLYLYDINGKLIRQLTKGDWEVLEVKGFDSKGENLFFVSTLLSAVNKNLCAVHLKTGKMTLLTPYPVYMRHRLVQMAARYWMHTAALIIQEQFS